MHGKAKRKVVHHPIEKHSQKFKGDPIILKEAIASERKRTRSRGRVKEEGKTIIERTRREVETRIRNVE